MPRTEWYAMEADSGMEPYTMPWRRSMQQSAWPWNAVRWLPLKNYTFSRDELAQMSKERREQLFVPDDWEERFKETWKMGKKVTLVGRSIPNQNRRG